MLMLTPQALLSFHPAHPAHTEQPEQPTHPAYTRRSPRTLLVVGSPAEWVSLSRSVLGGHPGLTVLGVVDSGREALSLIPNLQPDIVLVDAETRDLDGGEVLRRLSRMARTGRMILSGPADGLHWRYKAQAAGAAGYLPRKQVDASRVLALL